MLLKAKQLSSSFRLQFTHTPHSKHQPRRVNGVHEIWTNPSSRRPTEKMSPKLKLIYPSFALRLHNLHSNKRTRKTNKSHFLFFLFNEPFITDGEADIQVNNPVYIYVYKVYEGVSNWLLNTISFLSVDGVLGYIFCSSEECNWR